jgi:hypothetical protein
MKNGEEHIHCCKGGADQHFLVCGTRQRVSKFHNDYDYGNGNGNEIYHVFL